MVNKSCNPKGASHQRDAPFWPMGQKNLLKKATKPPRKTQSKTLGNSRKEKEGEGSLPT